jgi:hypothetical protein
MRNLGLRATSAGSIRIVKREVARLGLDTSHFSGQRRWSDAQLQRAAVTASSWQALAAELGLAALEGDDRVRVKAHAVRLGLDLSRLDASKRPPVTEPVVRPDREHIREAGGAIAAMWFSLSGCPLSFPIEPAVYDLLVSMPDGIKRVQVKTTTSYLHGWVARVGRRPYSPGNNGLMTPYDPAEIDWFFVIDGDFTLYLVPSRVIAGRVQILLTSYKEFIVGSIALVLAGPQAVPAA